MSDRPDTTHDRNRRSWVLSANGDTDFPVQNLPFGRFRRDGAAPRCGVAIGDQVFNLAAAEELGLLDGPAGEAASAAAGDDLLPLLRLGRPAAAALRARLSDLLTEGGDDRARTHADRLLVPQAAVGMLLPTTVRQFSDMCVSTFHIGRRNGTDERGEPICPPVFRAIPVGYDGRASSVVVSGTPVRRPRGTWTEELLSGPLHFGPEPRQDYELEVGLWLGGSGNAFGQPLTMTQARAAIWGLCLLNDWSARGIQFWESMLGPFLGKNLATTVSPWIVTVDALTPFRAPAFARPEGDPRTPAYLYDAEDQAGGAFSIGLTAALRTARMRAAGAAPHPVCRTDFRHMYWTFAQMVTHHASNGCSLAAGDLLGSGTCSGPDMSAAACLVEANMAGALALPSGERREWLEDGDEVILSARAERDGFVTIGFGECSGRLIPALP